MRKKGTVDQYPIEIKRAAIMKLKEGGHGMLTAVAKEIGAPKTTVKYWWDNAKKIMGEDNDRGLDPKIARFQNLIIYTGWREVYEAYKLLREKMKEGSLRDLVYAISELQTKLMEITPAGANGKMGSEVVVVAEERRVTVRNFLAKQQDRMKTGLTEGPEIALTRPAPEPRPSLNSEPLVETTEGVEDEEKEANG